MKSEQEVEEMLSMVLNSTNLDKLTGMTYKQGIIAALEWLLDELTEEELLNG